MSAYWINFDEEDSNHINQENKKSVKNQPLKKKKTTCIGGRVGGKEKCITSDDIKNKLEAANKRREVCFYTFCINHHQNVSSLFVSISRIIMYYSFSISRILRQEETAEPFFSIECGLNPTFHPTF